MKIFIFFLFILPLQCFNLIAQVNKGINFQGVARNNNGIILANKIINLRLSIKTDSTNGITEYQEIKSITTNTIGLFSVVVGSPQDRNIISIGNFENINWSNTEKFLEVEVDLTGELYFSSLGIQKINYVPYAFYADKVDAVNINGILGIKKGGTGFDNLKDFKINAGLDKVNNTPDSLKPTSLYTLIALNEKLKKSDTAWLSNRIDTKLNKWDTNYLSNRIDLKLNKLDTLLLSTRINQKLNMSDTLKIYKKINQVPIIDTNSLSQRINLKLNKSDTNYLSTRINNKISIGSLGYSDVTNALNYYKDANSQKHPTIAARRAILLLKSQGASTTDQVFPVLLQAAEQWDALAQYHLARFYASGIGNADNTNNPVEAAYWLQILKNNPYGKPYWKQISTTRQTFNISDQDIEQAQSSAAEWVKTHQTIPVPFDYTKTLYLVEGSQ